MADLRLDLADGVKGNDKMTTAPPSPRRRYRALTELFKNGKTIPPGDTVELDPATAEASINAGDVEEVEQ